MPFPSVNTHRRNRRKLGRGQQPGIPPTTVAVTAGGANVARLTFSRPVVVNGTVPVTVATRTFVSQTQTSPTVVDVTMSGAVTGLDYAVPGNMATVRPAFGGEVSGTSGTFP